MSTAHADATPPHRSPLARTVAVFAGSRADLWPLVPVLEALVGSPDVVPVLLAGGTVGAAEIAEVTARPILAHLRVVELGARPEGPGPADLVAAAGRGAAGVAGWLCPAPSRADPGDPEAPRADLLCVLGDRYESLAAATAATVVGVPILHLHGGEVTRGSTDDGIRHAITKLAHLHCCATAAYAARVRALGEEAWRVHVTGAPGLDRLRADAALTSIDAVVTELGLPLRRPVALCTYHPPTAVPGSSRTEVDAILEALAEVATVLVTAPGADPGAAGIAARLRDWCASGAGRVFVPSFGARYPAVLAGVDVAVGNSSSFIVEAPTLGVPTVNVGERQAGRVRAASILDVAGEPAQVRAALRTALSPRFRERARTAPNPYGDGCAAPRIVEVVQDAPFDRLIPKAFVDPPSTACPGASGGVGSGEHEIRERAARAGDGGSRRR